MPEPALGPPRLPGSVTLRPSSGRARPRRPGRRRRGRPRRRAAPRCRSATAAACGSWVTMITVWPNSSTAWRSRPRTSSEACESRLPVGSSANSTAGRCTSARATATRCCWPPESSDGRCVSRSRSPIVSISWSSHFWSGCVPASCSGSVMFSSAVSTGTRLKAWKTNPSRSRRSRVRPAVVEAREFLPVDHHRSRGGLVQPGEQVHQRRLPGARRAHDGRELPGREGQRHAGERVHGGLALAVGTAQVRRRNDVHRRSIVAQAARWRLRAAGSLTRRGRG